MTISSVSSALPKPIVGAQAQPAPPPAANDQDADDGVQAATAPDVGQRVDIKA